MSDEIHDSQRPVMPIVRHTLQVTFTSRRKHLNKALLSVKCLVQAANVTSGGTSILFVAKVARWTIDPLLWSLVIGTATHSTRTMQPSVQNRTAENSETGSQLFNVHAHYSMYLCSLFKADANTFIPFNLISILLQRSHSILTPFIFKALQ